MIEIGSAHLDLVELQTRLDAAGVPHNALGTNPHPTRLRDPARVVHTYDEDGMPMELPPEAEPIVLDYLAEIEANPPAMPLGYIAPPDPVE